MRRSNLILRFGFASVFGLLVYTAAAAPIALCDPLVLPVSSNRTVEQRLALLVDEEKIAAAGQGEPDFYRVVVLDPGEELDEAPTLRTFADPGYNYESSTPIHITRTGAMQTDESGTYLIVVLAEARYSKSAVCGYVFRIDTDPSCGTLLEDVLEPQSRRLEGSHVPSTVSFSLPRTASDEALGPVRSIHIVPQAAGIRVELHTSVDDPAPTHFLIETADWTCTRAGPAARD